MGPKNVRTFAAPARQSRNAACKRSHTLAESHSDIFPLRSAHSPGDVSGHGPNETPAMYCHIGPNSIQLVFPRGPCLNNSFRISLAERRTASAFVSR